MKLEDYRKDYYAFSAKASDISRQLALAGIAVVWVFKYERHGSPAVPEALLFPAFLFCLALAFDLAQSTTSSAIWGAFARFHERRGKADDTELEAPAYFNWPALVFFWGKLGLVVAGFVLVLVHIVTLLRAA